MNLIINTCRLDKPLYGKFTLIHSLVKIDIFDYLRKQAEGRNMTIECVGNNLRLERDIR